jgi:hypothetical protein
MNIIEMNAGEKISYEASETAISFSAGEIEIDLTARQKDITVFLDIFWNENGALQEESGDAYAANIIIPPWAEREVDTGETDDEGRAIYTKERDPFDMDNVTLQLWVIPDKYKK